MRTGFALLAILGSCLAAPQSRAASWFQPWLGIDADMTPAHCTQEVGGRCTVVCPASDGQTGYVEGTNTYSGSSSICAAAIHAGVLPRGKTSVVVVIIGAGARSYSGSDKNGVISHSHGPRASSFTFATDGAPGLINWQTVWSHIPADFTEPVTVTCPPGGDATGKIWGTDVYTVDSMICVAAAHAGLITAGNGGTIAVKRAPGLRQYAGTERFGVASRGAGANTDAFAVTAVRAASQPSPAGPAPVLRAFTLAGFNAVGSAPSSTIAPRTIQATSWTAVGSAPAATPVSPRTIQAPAWTAVGSAP